MTTLYRYKLSIVNNTPDNLIGNFSGLFLILWKGLKNKTRQKQIISNGYKHWWYWSNWNNTNLYIEHLLYGIVTTSTQRSPHTFIGELNEDNQK